MQGCKTMQNVILAFYYIAAGSTSLFFLLLIWPTSKSKRLLTGLIAIWLSVLGGAIVFTFAIGDGHQLGPSAYCVYGFLGISAGTAPLTFAVNNTVLFLLNAWFVSSRNSVDGDDAFATYPKTMSLLNLLAHSGEGQIAFP
jgi:hypothetical protein